MTILRTDSDHPDFQRLVRDLDQYLAGVNGDANDFFVQFNKIDKIKNVVLAIEDDIAVGCGAMRMYSRRSMEIKRMFVPVQLRGRGIASSILRELEQWAGELGYETCILETADTMVDAVGLYQKNGYKVIPNYGPYEQVKTSVCFAKDL